MDSFRYATRSVTEDARPTGRVPDAPRETKTRTTRRRVDPDASAAQRVAMTLMLVAAAFVLTVLLRRIIPYPFPFLFFAAVMASSWFGGPGVGSFSVLVSTAIVDYFFVPPYYSFVISSTNAAYFAAFVLCAFVASWVSASKKKDEEALREARDDLGVRVAERTAELQKSNEELRRAIKEHQAAQQALMQTQTELAHLSRVLTMGELTASIAHEISQPLAAVVVHGHAGIEWLSSNPPDVAKARVTVKRIIEDGTRAGAVLGRIRSLFSKQQGSRDWMDVNEVITELTVFLRDEALGHRILIQTDLAPDLPRVKGDRIQLQQVVLNLMMNAMEAIREVTEGPKELLVYSRRQSSEEVLIRVEDSGVGLSAEVGAKIFQPFFTTKPQGIGMGLSISRSIVESHGGRLWAVPRPSGGTMFQFTLPIREGNTDG